MKKTWKLINELSSKNTGKTNRVSELNFNNQEITAPMDIAEAFNKGPVIINSGGGTEEKRLGQEKMLGD